MITIARLRYANSYSRRMDYEINGAGWESKINDLVIKITAMFAYCGVCSTTAAKKNHKLVMWFALTYDMMEIPGSLTVISRGLHVFIMWGNNNI